MTRLPETPQSSSGVMKRFENVSRPPESAFVHVWPSQRNSSPREALAQTSFFDRPAIATTWPIESGSGTPQRFPTAHGGRDASASASAPPSRIDASSVGGGRATTLLSPASTSVASASAHAAIESRASAGTPAQSTSAATERACTGRRRDDVIWRADPGRHHKGRRDIDPRSRPDWARKRYRRRHSCRCRLGC